MRDPFRRKAAHYNAPSPDDLALTDNPFSFVDRVTSIDKLLPFSIQVTFAWQPIAADGHAADPYGAASALQTDIESIARHHNVLRCDRARQDIMTNLRALPRHSDGIVISAINVAVEADEETCRAARQIEAQRQAQRLEREALEHDCHLDALAQRQTRARVEFLRGQILESPATVELYKTVDRHSEFATRLGIRPDTDLDHLARQLHMWDSSSRWVSTATLLHNLLTDLSDSGRIELLILLSNTIRDLGVDELADKLAALAKEARTPPS
ncbi:hypothetical protein ACIP5Y_12755 [Nocardia sp. NPDC088792]|uniref:hypothetical protein n=1 Tax=Nocardia sp. NPDC088792 TaxID=3364332 RepID=UPI0038222934